MAKLSAAERDHLPSGAFVFPEERAFPIPDRAHAYDALRMAGHESPDRAAKVRDEVCKRFSIGCSGANVQGTNVQGAGRDVNDDGSLHGGQ